MRVCRGAGEGQRRRELRSFWLIPSFLEVIIWADPPQVCLFRVKAAAILGLLTRVYPKTCPGGLPLTGPVAQLHHTHIFRLPGGASLTGRAARTIHPAATGLLDVSASCM